MSSLYITDCVWSLADKSSRSGLRSVQLSSYVTLRLRTKFEELVFSFTGPTVWNWSSLPAGLHEVVDPTAFRKNLKIHFLTYNFNLSTLIFYCFVVLFSNYCNTPMFSLKLAHYKYSMMMIIIIDIWQTFIKINFMFGRLCLISSENYHTSNYYRLRFAPWTSIPVLFFLHFWL